MQWILWFDQPKVVKFDILPGWEILSENSLCQAAEFEVCSVLHTICGEVENGLPATWIASFQLQNFKENFKWLAADFEFTTIHMLPAKSSEIRHSAWQWNLRFQSLKFQVQISSARQRFLRFAVFYTRFGEKSKNHCQAHEIHVLQSFGRPLESTCRQWISSTSQMDIRWSASLKRFTGWTWKLACQWSMWRLVWGSLKVDLRP